MLISKFFKLRPLSAKHGYIFSYRQNVNQWELSTSFWVCQIRSFLIVYFLRQKISLSAQNYWNVSTVYRWNEEITIIRSHVSGITTSLFKHHGFYFTYPFSSTLKVWNFYFVSQSDEILNPLSPSLLLKGKV